MLEPRACALNHDPDLRALQLAALSYRLMHRVAEQSLMTCPASSQSCTRRISSTAYVSFMAMQPSKLPLTPRPPDGGWPAVAPAAAAAQPPAPRKIPPQPRGLSAEPHWPSWPAPAMCMGISYGSGKMIARTHQAGRCVRICMVMTGARQRLWPCLCACPRLSRPVSKARWLCLAFRLCLALPCAHLSCHGTSDLCCDFNVAWQPTQFTSL